VASGVPVALPRQGYDACKEYLRPYEAVIPFGSAEELTQSLRDRSFVEGLRVAAQRNRHRYHAENWVGSLLDFLEAVTRSPARTNLPVAV
jgi:hypothetical protein